MEYITSNERICIKDEKRSLLQHQLHRKFGAMLPTIKNVLQEPTRKNYSLY